MTRDFLEAIDDPETFEEAVRDVEEWLASEGVGRGASAPR